MRCSTISTINFQYFSSKIIGSGADIFADQLIKTICVCLLISPFFCRGMNSFKAAKVSERSRLWLQAISREDIPLEKLKNFTVCSNHFVTGCLLKNHKLTKENNVFVNI